MKEMPNAKRTWLKALAAVASGDDLPSSLSAVAKMPLFWPR
jgi:hypothetical protein